MEYDDRSDPIGEGEIHIIERSPYSPEKRAEKSGDLTYKRLKSGVENVDLRERDGTIVAVKGMEATLTGEAPGVRFALRTVHNNGALKDSEEADSKINKLSEDGFQIIVHKGRTLVVFYDGVGSEGGLEGTDLAATIFDRKIKEDATLMEALEATNKELCKINKGRAANVRATTVVLACEIEGDEGEMAWAGDAEGLLLNENGDRVFESVPHNLAALKLQEGTSKTMKAYRKDRKARSVITSCLGSEDPVEIGHMRRRKLQKGWRFVLRTDGLTDNASGYQTANIVKGEEDAGKALAKIFDHQFGVAVQEKLTIEDVELDGTVFSVALRPKADNAAGGVIEFLGKEPEQVSETLALQGWTALMMQFGNRVRQIMKAAGLA